MRYDNMTMNDCRERGGREREERERERERECRLKLIRKNYAYEMLVYCFFFCKLLSILIYNNFL